MATACLALSSRPDVRAVFTVRGALARGALYDARRFGHLRGNIDCLVRSQSGQVTVLEFKTGRRRQEHLEQIGLYRRAAGSLFPGLAVDALLVYSEGSRGGVEIPGA